MNATLRLTGLGNNSATLLQLSSSKLIELLVEDDDTLKELADGGSIVGLSLDEIERTPTRILRKKLREKQEDNTVLQTRNEKLATDNNRLLNQIEKLKTRELTHDDVELARQRDCQLLRKESRQFSPEIDGTKRNYSSDSLGFLGEWRITRSCNGRVRARPFESVFSGSWHHLQNQFEVGMANWQQHPVTGH